MTNANGLCVLQGNESKRSGKTSVQNSLQNSQEVDEENMVCSTPVAEPNLYEVFGIPDPRVTHSSQPFRIREFRIHLGLPPTSWLNPSGQQGTRPDDKGKAKAN